MLNGCLCSEWLLSRWRYSGCLHTKEGGSKPHPRHLGSFSN